MTTPLLLWLMASLDAMFRGYSAAAGKDALIDKTAYHRRALLRGFLAGQLAIFIGALLVLAAVRTAPDRAAACRDFSIAGARMLAVYVPYALLILATLAVRAIPSVDVRSLTSVLVFGPMSLLRPFVALAGIVSAVTAVPRISMIVVGGLVLALMLSLERWLSVSFNPTDRG
jgi:hypothetical protein